METLQGADAAQSDTVLPRQRCKDHNQTQYSWKNHVQARCHTPATVVGVFPGSNQATAAAGCCLLLLPVLLLRSCMFMYKPSVVWMVAPVVMLICCPGTKLKLNRFSVTARATTASMRANWSPTHLRGPPLKGMYLQTARAKTQGV